MNHKIIFYNQIHCIMVPLNWNKLYLLQQFNRLTRLTTPIFILFIMIIIIIMNVMITFYSITDQRVRISCDETRYPIIL